MLWITPQGKQREVMALPAIGHMVVLGTAGSGKTTMALLRAYHLSKLPNAGRVLLVTFNRALVKYMCELCRDKPRTLIVENYHKFARGYLFSRGKMPYNNGILNPDKKIQYIEDALKVVKKKMPSELTFQRSKEFFIDEIAFIQKFGFSNLDSYYEAERIGRVGANIKRDNRKWVFAVYEKYIELREQAGYKYDWEDIAFHVYNEFREDNGDRRYTHIIVDEGQDFSPMMIKSLAAAIPEHGSFTFLGDVAQQIYGSRLSWRDSGINVDKVWRFSVNYRNPAAIISFAKDIIKSKYWQKSSDMVDATDQIAEGPKPVLVKFSNGQDEVSWVVDHAISAGRNSSAVIICRNREDVNFFAQALERKGCIPTEITKDIPGYAHKKTVYLTTFHSAKGLEFDNVYIPFLNSEKLPDPEMVSSSVSVAEAYANEIKLLYVGVTRSKYGLYMSYSGAISILFPQEADSYDFHDGESAM
ncbi:3'-5' exonuclease [Selenomonas noxia]|jgi:superfamily I DNA/RNA helicase|uniref:3'-5' exonuclease n=1 Tax=Selenomonas noxia TaxID=135083 RepID=UPI0028D6770F|nr:3'-5' exonuclease [Selenomonas noxia]